MAENDLDKLDLDPGLRNVLQRVSENVGKERALLFAHALIAEGYTELDTLAIFVDLESLKVTFLK